MWIIGFCNDSYWLLVAGPDRSGAYSLTNKSGTILTYKGLRPISLHDYASAYNINNSKVAYKIIGIERPDTTVRYFYIYPLMYDHLFTLIDLFIPK